MGEVDDYIRNQPAWQQVNLAQFRNLIHSCAANVREEVKWNVPVFFVNDTMQFTMAGFKAHTKYNFILNGARIPDDKNRFNNGFESKKSRSIDLREGEQISDKDLTDLIQKSIDISL